MRILPCMHRCVFQMLWFPIAQVRWQEWSWRLATGMSACRAMASFPLITVSAKPQSRSSWYGVELAADHSCAAALIRSELYRQPMGADWPMGALVLSCLISQPLRCPLKRQLEHHWHLLCHIVLLSSLFSSGCESTSSNLKVACADQLCDVGSMLCVLCGPARVAIRFIVQRERESKFTHI